MILADKDRFGAIIGHLIRNAQDATAADGRVIVRLFKRNVHATIEVQDNGCGMDSDFIKDRLFRPFDSTKGKAGMGIGVYETRDYIHRLGGDLEVISRVGEGSTFRIRLTISDTELKSRKVAVQADDTVCRWIHRQENYWLLKMIPGCRRSCAGVSKAMM